jgi:sirohydrochlorin ferrochelatase
LLVVDSGDDRLLERLEDYEAIIAEARGSGDPDGLVKLSGQHQLLGWHVSGDVLDFVREVHAEIDVDEYG